MQMPMMSCDLIPLWHKWNANAGDAMVTWFTSDANLVTSQWACASHACMQGTCAIIKMGVPQYLNGLTGTPANSNLRKLTTSYFQVLPLVHKTCNTFFSDWWFWKCNPCRICGFCTRVGLVTLESQSIDEYKTQSA